MARFASRSLVAGVVAGYAILFALPRPVHASPERPVAEISATVSSEVMQDQVRIALSAQVQADSAAAVNQQLADIIEEARKRIGTPAGVRLSTGNVQTYPRYGKDGKITGWQGRGDIVLQSMDVSAATASADKVTDLLALSGASFSLSDRARRAEQSRLMDAVAHAFREKANSTARAFGFSGFQIQRLTVSESGEMPSPRPVLMSARAADSAENTGLTLLPDVQKVSVTVTGLIELR